MKAKIGSLVADPFIPEDQMLLLGSVAARQVSGAGVAPSLQDTEFKVFSQFGDDGIIHYLTERLPITSDTFVEFGVGDYMESNTRFLLMHKNWSGFVMEGSEEAVARLMTWPSLWRYELEARAVFIDRDNIDGLLVEAGLPRDLGLLHIDLDGNDYWVWERIRCIDPTIVIMEYNAVFGSERKITIPYDPSFDRTTAHPTWLYWGASLGAMHMLAATKGYAFVGCNRAGNNAYFVKREALGNGVREVDLAEGFVRSKLRDSRGPDGALTLLGGDSRLDAIRGMPVINLETMTEEPL
jgi:hypothetical protein